MEKRKIAVIGGGPAGFMAAVSAAENWNGQGQQLQVDIHEKSVPLKTILCTGNGRCNLSNNIADFKELAGNFPRGEKFLYSVFSRFGVPETLDRMDSMGLKTYVQPDNRIFPKTNRAASVRQVLLKKASDYNINIIKTCVETITKKNGRFAVCSDFYDAVILATGGNRGSGAGYKIARGLGGHKVTKLKPSLTELITLEKWVKNMAGVSIKNARVQSFFNKKEISDITGDFVFTHNGLTGPAVFNTSSYSAFLDFSQDKPLLLKINFIPYADSEKLVQDLPVGSDKSALSVLKKYIPKSLAAKLLLLKEITPGKKFSSFNMKEKEAIIEILQNTRLKIIAASKEGEIVTAGGIDLKQADSRTMESKLIPGLFFCGEVLDIDGLTGGFNLQMCWSTGYIAGLNAIEKLYRFQ